MEPNFFETQVYSELFPQVQPSASYSSDDDDDHNNNNSDDDGHADDAPSPSLDEVHARLSSRCPSFLSPVLRFFLTCWAIFVAHPFVLVGKAVFWAINIVSGGAHLQGSENGMHRLFPGIPPAALPKVSVPFKASDAAAHVAVSILGSNEMVEGVSRIFQKQESFWHKHATLLQKVLFSLLTLFLVTTAEVSSTYRNWQNNDGLPIASRIFWVSFYLCSHVPEVLFSTMLMVRDYFNGPRIPPELKRQVKDAVVRQITLFQLHQQEHPMASVLSSSPDLQIQHPNEDDEEIGGNSCLNNNPHYLNNNNHNHHNQHHNNHSMDEEKPSSSSSSSLKHSSSSSSLSATTSLFDFHGIESPLQAFDPLHCLEQVAAVDLHITWISRIVGVLFVLPTYVVKGMSSVDGFMVLTGKNKPASWTLGMCGMLAEAYLEYAFTQGLIGEIATMICYRIKHFARSNSADPFYAHLPKTTVFLVLLGLVVGLLTIPGSYNSAFGVLPDSWGAAKQAVCWMYAIRYILQAALGIKLLFKDTIEHFLCTWNPAYGRMIQSISTTTDELIRAHQ